MHHMVRRQITVVVRSKAYLWGNMVAGIASSNPHEGVDVPVLCLL
jgi:hypothetical protein